MFFANTMSFNQPELEFTTITYLPAQFSVFKVAMKNSTLRENCDS
jgi:hypothetical protein